MESRPRVYSEVMLSLKEPQRARFDEALARSEKEVGATKAALYLSIEGEPYELVTWYGFREPPRPQIAGNDLVVERLITRKSAYWINGATTTSLASVASKPSYAEA